MPKIKKGVAGFSVFLMLTFVIFLTACSNKEDNSKFSEPSKPSTTVNDNLVDSSEPDISSENEERVSYVEIGGLELPVNNATGYTSIVMDLKKDASFNAPTISTLKAGTAFKIIKEEGDWWFVQIENTSGWLEHKFLMINLPDVIPSIIYDNTNTYSSKFLSSGKSIPGVTGKALYKGKAYNERLGKSEFIMPALYTMAKKISLAQQYALKEGNSLKIYEAFRPYGTQQAVFRGLSKLANSDSEVMKGITTSPWRINWFIVKGVSNHQMGYAIDVSLVKINSKKDASIGVYTYPKITRYTEYKMPTPIHELSGASAAFAAPVSSKSQTDWKGVALASSMNDAAKSLQTYVTTAGFTPLASEWWHFNDLDAMNEISGNTGNGNFYLNESNSSVPTN